MALTEEELEAYAEELERKFGADHVRRKKREEKKHEESEEPRREGRQTRWPERQEIMAQARQTTKEVEMTEYTPQREQSSFGRALYLARQIEDRDADTTQLKAAMAQLDENGRRNLIFRLVGEVLEGRTKVPGLFAAARAAKMITVAYNTAAVYNAARRGGLSLQDLVRVGLAEPITWTDRDGKTQSRIVYRVGREALRAAALELRKQYKRTAAEILENHLLQAEKRLIVRQAVRDTSTSAAETAAEVEEPAPEPKRRRGKKADAEAEPAAEA